MERNCTRIGSASWVGLFAGLLLALGGTASAEQPADDFESELTGVTQMSVVTTNELEVLRGGDGEVAEVVMISETDMDASVNGNSVGDNSFTGHITFTDSFSQNSGIQSSMINSGNNVSMQSSMSVNLYLDD